MDLCYYYRAATSSAIHEADHQISATQVENDALADARAKGIAAPSRREDNGCGVFRRVPEVRRRRGDYV